MSHGVEVDVGPGRPPTLSQGSRTAPFVGRDRSDRPVGPSSVSTWATRSGRSPAIRPSPFPRGPGAPVHVGGQRRPDQRVETTGEERPDDAGQHVAGAGGGERRGARPPEQHPTAGVGHRGGGSFDQGHGPRGRGEGPGRPDAVGAGRTRHQPGVLPIVGSEHEARPGPGCAERSRVVRTVEPAEGEQPVGIDHDRHRRLGHQAPDLHRRRRVPAQTRAHHQGRTARRGGEGVGRPTLGGQAHAHRLRGRGGRRARPREHPAAPCRRPSGRPTWRTGRRLRSYPASPPPPVARPTICVRPAAGEGGTSRRHRRP